MRFVQTVRYPLFDAVGDTDFVAAPPMLVELETAGRSRAREFLVASNWTRGISLWTVAKILH